jgi:hypothetical protein
LVAYFGACEKGVNGSWGGLCALLGTEGLMRRLASQFRISSFQNYYKFLGCVNLPKSFPKARIMDSNSNETIKNAEVKSGKIKYSKREKGKVFQKRER